jgi:GNAT superfamily N-acetyltransferase
MSMSRIRIIPFDVDTASQESWSALHVHRRTIAAELYPDDPILSDAECEYEMRRPNPLGKARRWLAFDGPDIVASAGAWFRPAGAPNAAEHARFLSGYGSVAAAARRRGIGTQLLRRVHALMHDLDKSILTLSAHTDAGHAFLTHVGAAAKHSSLESRALLKDLDWARLRTWDDAAADLGLTWECYAGRVPREVLTQFLPAFTAMIADVPVGSLEIPPIRIEIETYDRWYESLDRSDGAHHLILLRAPDGAVVGMSEASWDSRTPKIAYQAFTAVAKPWRGRGLARAVKAAILRQVRSSHPDAEEMRTYNAESNAPILSINKRLGFRVSRRYVDYQITRAELDATGLRSRTARSPG